MTANESHAVALDLRNEDTACRGRSRMPHVRPDGRRSAKPGAPRTEPVSLRFGIVSDEALVILDRVHAAPSPKATSRKCSDIERCVLLALNRTSDAQHAIEIVFSRDPLFRLSDGDAPPRMRAAFNDVRRRLMPKVTEQLHLRKADVRSQGAELAVTHSATCSRFSRTPTSGSRRASREFRTLATGFAD